LYFLAYSMKIVDRTALRAALVLLLILSVFAMYVYYFYADFREKTFYDQLKSTAISRQHFLNKTKWHGIDVLSHIDSFGEYKIKGEQIAIYDTTGEIIYKNTPDVSRLNSKIVQKLLKNKEIRLEKDDFERVVFVNYDNYINQNEILESAGYDSIGFSKQENLKKILIIGVLISVLIIATITRYFITIDLKPMQKIAEKMKTISAKNLHERLDESKLRDEIGQMAVTFNQLLDRVEGAYAQQRNFVSYVTHELRTPLTVMQGQTEVGLMKERTNKEYKNLLDSVSEEVREMIKLVNDLLELARANADSQSIDFHAVRVDELLWQARTQLLQKKTEYNISIEFDKFPENEEQMTVIGNAHLLKMAFLNPMENACKYANGSVNVLINAEKKHMEIRFEDSGAGIPLQDLEHIFEPFYRSKSATTSNISGHGIGLPLTKRIIEIHRGECEIQSIIDNGTKVSIRLPYK
jgi:signal transduction histidine kinase